MASDGDLDLACTHLRLELQALSDGDVVRAASEFAAAMRRAYDWGLWGAAYLIHGGCSNDAFWDFRAGLIGLGRDVFETALKDPDSLASVPHVEDRTLFEGFQYVPGRVLEARHLVAEPGTQTPPRPTGETWEDDAELARRYPKLAARFP